MKNWNSKFVFWWGSALKGAVPNLLLGVFGAGRRGWGDSVLPGVFVLLLSNWSCSAGETTSVTHRQLFISRRK